MHLVKQIEDMELQLSEWRQDLHAHPELGFEEHRTSDFVASKLEEFGVEVHREIGKTGVVGVLRQGNETRSIGLRADMDALPISETNEFSHKSKNPGKMHACGHDGHTVMLLAAAKYLAESRSFSGQVNFIFQPAEEGLGGAKAMIDDGLFDKFPCDRVYAMHNGPGIAVGKFASVPGIRTAAGAFFDIKVIGKGGHGAFPQFAIDPITIAAEIIGAIQTIISRTTSPNDSAVLSITKVHAGDAYNVIPESAMLSGTVRTFAIDKMQEIERQMISISEGISKAHGGTALVEFNTLFLPVLNEEEATDLATEVCRDMVGQDNVITTGSAGTGSEDFSFMSNEIPGCYVIIGNGEDSNALHNPNFDFNDEALVYGGSFFARVIEKELALDQV
jgi:amidohydrolase|tara:strand:+ start:7 stop:1176 length:1170 start_codon:yes stop_codon:yes gene_type:complete